MNSPPFPIIKTLMLNGADDGIQQASFILRKGGIVAVPTETVYGLAGNGFDSCAIAKIFLAKGRPKENPLILHTDSFSKAAQLFAIDNARFYQRLEKLAYAFWPGPLTIVAQKASNVPDEVTALMPSVGVRIPRHETTLALLRELDFPLAMPSANISKRPSPTTAQHVLKTLDGRIDAVIEGGTCGVGIESTIVQIDLEQVEILRLGMITKKMLEECLLEPVIDKAHEHREKPRCPGAAFLHYAPKIASVKLINKEDAEQSWHGADMMLMRESDCAELLTKLGERPQGSITTILSDDADEFGHKLYDALYGFEAYPKAHLTVVAPPKTYLWHAIHDRLSRSVF